MQFYPEFLTFFYLIKNKRLKQKKGRNSGKGCMRAEDEQAY